MAAEDSGNASTTFTRENLLGVSIVLLLSSAYCCSKALSLTESKAAGASITLSVFGLALFFLRSSLRVWDSGDNDSPYRFKEADAALTFILIPSHLAGGLFALAAMLDAWRHWNLREAFLALLCFPLPAYAAGWWLLMRRVRREVADGTA
jgi:hypothetical protein